jgi:hypothetical protein
MAGCTTHLLCRGTNGSSLLLFLACVVTFIGFSSPVRSAEISYSCSDGYCWMLLQGDVISGDSARFEQALAEIRNQNAVAIKIFLMSRGGAVEEAIEIGEMVRSALIETVAPRWETIQPDYMDWSTFEELREKCLNQCIHHFSMTAPGLARTSSPEAAAYLSSRQSYEVIYDPNTLCASACALIALAGVKRYGMVGLHHIFVQDENLSFDDFQWRLSEGVDLLEDYLREIRVPPTISETIFSTPSQEVAWLNLSEELKYDSIFYEYLNGRCDLLSEDLLSLRSRLALLNDLGAEIDQQSGRVITRTLTPEEQRTLADLEQRWANQISCMNNETLAAQRQAQGQLVR